MPTVKTILNTLNFIEPLARFPLAVTALVMTWILFNISMDMKIDMYGANSVISVLFISAVFLFPLALVQHIAFERNVISNKLSYILSPITAIILTLLLYSFPHNTQSVILISIGLIIFAAISPYLGRKDQNGLLSKLSGTLPSIIGASVALCLILCLFIFFTEKTMDDLLDIGFGSTGEDIVYSFIIIVLGPSLVLARLPKDWDIIDERACLFARFALNYLFIPLCFIYFAILYVYFGMIAIEQKLPDGRLGSMIGIFTLMGIIGHFCTRPYVEDGHKWVRWFYKGFYPLLLIPLGFFAYALYVRIDDQGLTAMRVIYALFCAWSIGLALYMIFSKVPRYDWVIALAALILIFASIGPWSAHIIAFHSQKERFETLAIHYGLLDREHGFLEIQDRLEIPYEDRKAMTGSLNYIMDKYLYKKANYGAFLSSEKQEEFDKMTSSYKRSNFLFDQSKFKTTSLSKHKTETIYYKEDSMLALPKDVPQNAHIGQIRLGGTLYLNAPFAPKMRIKLENKALKEVKQEQHNVIELKILNTETNRETVESIDFKPALLTRYKSLKSNITYPSTNIEGITRQINGLNIHLKMVDANVYYHLDPLSIQRLYSGKFWIFIWP